jgi:hypothetical protein
VSGYSEQLISLSVFISVLKTFVITIASKLQAICLVSVALQPHKIEPCAVPVMLQLPGMLHCKVLVLSMRKCQQECMQGYLLNRILFLLGRFVPYSAKELLQWHVVKFMPEILLCSNILCVLKVLHFCPTDDVSSVEIFGMDSLEHPEIETSCLWVTCSFTEESEPGGGRFSIWDANF